MAATPSQSANANDTATWRFHDRLQFITHDAHQCDVCDQWLSHFAHAMARRNVTLAEAEAQRDAAILGQLPAECAKLRKDLEAARAELSDLRLGHEARVDGLRDRLRESNSTNHRLREELAEARKTDAKLRNESDQNELDHNPRPRKVARLQGTSPSPSRLPSHPDSTGTMLKDSVAGPPHPPPPSPVRIRAATTSLPSVQPPETPSSSSHAHSPAPRGNLLSRLADPTPVAPAPSNPPALPPPVASAPSPRLPSVGTRPTSRPTTASYTPRAAQ